jgi:hypothetical protein
MHEAGLALEDAGEFGHLFFEFGVGLQFNLDYFGDWLGHGGGTVGVVCVAMGAFVRGSEKLGFAGDVGLAVDVGLSGDVVAAEEVAGERDECSCRREGELSALYSRSMILARHLLLNTTGGVQHANTHRSRGHRPVIEQS